MRVRHRIPSIFNLSMVDVLCCALGCVILIWLINLRDSKQHQEKTADLLQQKQTDIDDLNRQRAAVQKQADEQADALRDLDKKWKDALAHAASLQGDLETRGKELAAARAAADDLTHKLVDAASRIKDLQGVADLVPGLRSGLKKVQDQYAGDEAKLLSLTKDVTQRSQDLDETTRKLLASQKDAAQRALDLDDAGKKLTALQTVRLKLETDLDDRKKEIALLRPYKDKYAADEDQVLSLKKELTDFRRNADVLETDRVKWRKEAERVKAEADNRFAGITLTGKRVVFLVDTSGSMDYIDDDTKAPDKWLGVRTTVSRIMRSLPELEKFQVVTFSEKPHFPLGGDGKWIDYDPKTSNDLVFQTLADVKPEGGTNMYDPMDIVFRMRAQGLDTVYFCSDGLPNLGEGIMAQEIAKLTELERGALLGQVIRKKLKTDWNREIDGKPRVRLNTIGFFYESPDVGAFLWALARENEGSFVGMSKP